MRIVLTKLSDQQHGLELIRRDGSRESIELVTREALFHDFVHYAVESSMATQGGFWGALASGKTMADLNDRTGAAMQDFAGTLYAVEAWVGMLSGVVGLPEEEAWAKLRWYLEAQEREPPEWCTESFVTGVRECLRRLQGQWKATPYGESMEITWDET